MNKTKKRSLIWDINIINIVLMTILLTATIFLYVQVIYKESSKFRLQSLYDADQNVTFLIEDKQRHIALHPISILSVMESDLLSDDEKRTVIEDIIEESPDLLGIIQIDQDNITTQMYPIIPNIIGYNIVEIEMRQVGDNTAYFTDLVQNTIYDEDHIYYVMQYDDGYLLFAHKLDFSSIIGSYNIDLNKFIIKVIDDSNRIIYASNNDYILENQQSSSYRTYNIDDQEIALRKEISGTGETRVFITSDVSMSGWKVKVSSKPSFLFGTTVTNVVYPALFIFIIALSFLANYIFVNRFISRPLGEFIENMNLAKSDLLIEPEKTRSNYDIFQDLDMNFQLMREAIIARDKNLEEFVYIASHDLQEPLRMIASYIDIIEMDYKSRFDEDGIKYLQYVIDATKRMKQLINDLLQYSRLDHLDMEDDIDLRTLILELIDNIGYLDNSMVKIEVGELPLLKGNQVALNQVFQNLISNAVKFNENNPIIKIYHERNSIMIEDNGIGIDDKYIDQIFIPFKRLNSKTKYAGTGIGLAIVKKVIEKHGWSITCKSIKDQGTTFIINMEGKNEK